MATYVGAPDHRVLYDQDRSGMGISNTTGLYRPALKMPNRFRPAQVVTNFAASHGWSASGSGTASSEVNDTTDFVTGDRSARATTTGTGAVSNIERLTGLSINATARMFRIRIKIDSGSFANLQRINVFAGDTSLTNNYKWFLQTNTATTNYIQEGEWVTITLPWSDIVATTGTPNRGVITAFRVQVTDNSSGAVTWRVDSVETVADATSKFPNGVVSIVADDCRDSIWTLLKPLMDARGMSGTMFTIADAVGTSGRLTMAQLKAMQDHSGWEIGGHAATAGVHNAADGLLSSDGNDQDREFEAMKNWLVVNGFNGEGFAYPQGKYNAAAIEKMRKYFSYGRTILYENKESWPPADPYRLRGITGISSLATAGDHANPTKLTSAGGPLELATTEKAWVILIFHVITTGAAAVTTECALADATTVLDKVASQGMACAPIGEVLAS